MPALGIKQAGADMRLDNLAIPKGGAWISESRKSALRRLVAQGLPGRRDEYWKFPRPDRLIAADADPAEVLAPDDTVAFHGVDCLRLVFIDGVFDTAASDPLLMEFLEIEPLNAAQTQDLHWARELYGVLEARGQTPVARPLGALNTATATEGLLMRITGQVPRPVSIEYRRSAHAADAIIHHVIKIETGGDLTLLESGAVAARVNKLMEVDVADGASFHHIRMQGRDQERIALTHIFARLGQKSSFKSFTLTMNGALTRNECVIEMLGDDAHATIAGASAGDGVFHQDDTIFITHEGVNCESRQVFKKVLRNGATGVFQGKILVKPTAQKTDGYQISQGLLLDEDAQFLAKPELEIYADDVVCSHGSTVGAIDEDALFYLISRGVPRRLAQDMLVLAFLLEALDEIENEEIRDDIRARLEAWVERHHS
ncbi:MAG: Fe-S cluster assembly protein SufD [Alphaproteobacteria bacterium]|nr:Fe-S cluster assembly protein SufD [Alphaproteobacteria bacterium]